MRIELPPGNVVQSLPEPVTLDISFAAYRSKVRIEDNVLVYERVFEQKEFEVRAPYCFAFSIPFDSSHNMNCGNQPVLVLGGLPRPKPCPPF